MVGRSRDELTPGGWLLGLGVGFGQDIMMLDGVGAPRTGGSVPPFRFGSRGNSRAY